MDFYIGLSAALPVDTNVELFFTFGGDRSGPAERRRILQELCARMKDCSPQPNPCARKAGEAGATKPEEHHLAHYGVRTAWEFLGMSGGAPQWLPLDASAQRVEDNTRSLTLNGNVVFRLPGPMNSAQIGVVPAPLYYLRCRFVAGSYDAAPILLDAAFNGVAVEQAVPSGMSFIIDAAASISYAPQGQPKPGDMTTLTLALDARKRIVELKFGGDPEKEPSFLIYDYRAPAGGAAGLLALEGVFLGFGTGFPNQQYAMADAPVERSSFRLYTLEANTWHRMGTPPGFGLIIPQGLSRPARSINGNRDLRRRRKGARASGASCPRPPAS